MEIVLELRPLSSLNYDVILLGMCEEESLEHAFNKIDNSFPQQFLKQILATAEQEGFTGKFKDSIQLPTYGQLASPTLILYGLGKRHHCDPTHLRKALGHIARGINNKSTIGRIYLNLPLNEQEEGSGKAASLQAIVEGWLLGSYSFTKYKTSEDTCKKSISCIGLAAPGIARETFDMSIRTGRQIAYAQNFARDLITEPAAYMTPKRLSEVATSLVDDTITCNIINARTAEELSMGAFLAVARGASEPPYFIVLKYNPVNSKKVIALVGKGVTFDSGGLSLKTSQSMEHMKYDMSGAAVVLATIRALKHLKPSLTICGFIAATENMPGSAALHPGDIVTAMNGKTIEVNNTDAEGRLILADALCYASNQMVDEIIDVATLTSGVVTALGRAAAGIMGNDQVLIDKIIRAGKKAGEKFWQLPLFEEYKEALNSTIADLKNTGLKGEASSACAAMFLSEFVDNKPWAHLDIAGPAWLERETDDLGSGGTAFGVKTLCYYVLAEEAFYCATS